MIKMTVAWNNYSILLYLFALLSHLDIADAHGYLSSPRSRNYYASVEGTNGSQNGVPTKEYCPHCLNRKAADDNCGIGQNGSYDHWKDSNGNPMQWITQATYNEDQNIFVGGLFTTNHAGHIEMYACSNYMNPTPACFDANPLEMVEDTLYSGPNDATYPVRGYISPAYEFGFLYKLPSGLRGDNILLQWKYITANSCHPPGYKDPALGLDNLGWLRGPTLPPCGNPDPTGVGLPEQFWNCAEVTILDSGNPTTPTGPTPTPPTPTPPTPTPPTPTPPTPTPPTPTPPTPNPPTPTPPNPPSSGYCSWSTPICNGVDSSSWCSASKVRCDGCIGTWCGATGPTPAPTSTPPGVSGYCSWTNPLCNGIDNSPWCSVSNVQCGECGGTWCPSSPSQPTANPPTPIPPTSGPKYATTTRYWDCSGGACGCAYLPFGPGTDSEPAMCHSNAMFEAPPNNPNGATFYGTAAISQGLGGGNWLAEGCGKCWKVTGKSNAPGYEGVETTIVLKGVNFCPPGNVMCANDNPHFDIGAPGFDVTEFSLSNTCSVREAEEREGFAACGRWLIDSNNPDENCNCNLFKDPVLRAGCTNFLSLMWDNSPVLYDEINCPTELSRLNCWADNGNKYPDDTPQFCANNGDVPNPPTPSTMSPVQSPAGGTCGDGNVGDGVCPDGNCCSKYGWCGTTTDHCATLPPTSAPPPTAPTNPVTASDDSRLIAYLGNWQSCPTPEIVTKYTHIVIAFAVSYVWSKDKNICSTTCTIDTPPVCANASNPSLIADWQAAGKKVILSFGGAGMGGSWDEDNNDCWDYCFGREDAVVDRLVEIVGAMNLDGVDIDYEYFYEDNQNNSGFTKGAAAQKFLKDVTLGLRQKLPADSEITHAPMDVDAVPGKAYYDILVQVGPSLDFLMPQYYNGITRPIIDGVAGTVPGRVSALQHYTTLVNNVFGGDPSHMVFGFCISGCSLTGSNANSAQAAVVMSDLSESYSCNGGAFFWVSEHDINGDWSEGVSAVIQPNAGCSNGPNPPTPTLPAPTPPTPITTSPVQSPVTACGNKMNLKVEIMNDLVSNRLKYFVQMRNTKGKWMKKKIMKKNKLPTDMLYTREKCVNARKCYRFKIIDPDRDGIYSNEHGPGYFKVFWDGEIYSKRFAKGKSKAVTFGECEEMV